MLRKTSCTATHQRYISPQRQFNANSTTWDRTIFSVLQLYLHSITTEGQSTLK